jgi:ribosomal protein S18 acetylase RimI-like enzyme
MNRYSITPVFDSGHAETQQLEEEIHRFNFAVTGIRENRGVTYVLRGEEGEMVGGIHGWTWGGCLQIHYLWVREDLRGQGYGTGLLRCAEADARRGGCSQVVLETHSFQAPEFYRGQGYEVFGVVDDYPPGGAKYYLRKQLTDPSG